MFQKRSRKAISMILCLLFLSGLMGFTAFADPSKRERMGNSPSNLSPASSSDGSGVGPGWLTYDGQSVCFASSGRIYQTSLSGGSTSVLWDSGNAEASLGGLNLYDGFLYFTDGFRIQRVSLADHSADTLLSTPGLGDHYYENLFLLDGTLYYVDQYQGELWRMNPDGSGKQMVSRLNDISMLGDESRLDLHFQYQYAFSEDALYYCALDPQTIESAALVRIPLSGGAESVTAPARSDPAGGGYSPDPSYTSVWEPFAPVPDNGWIYYIEDYETRTSFSNGGRMRYLSPIGGIWRARPDGSEKQLLYQNIIPGVYDYGAMQFGPVSSEKAISAYTVRDDQVFLLRDGAAQSGGSAPFPDAVYKLENGAVTALYSAPAASGQTDSQLLAIASAPDWIYFTQKNISWSKTVDGDTIYYDYAPDVIQVYRMRLDGSGLECLTQ